MSNNSTIPSFLLVDDHMIIRTGLKILINEEFYGSTIDEAENTIFAKKFLDKQKYDLIILDINIPDDNIFDFVLYLKAVNENQKILMFSMNNEELYANKFLKLGVKGYLSKQTADSEIKKAIRTVLNGSVYLSATLQNLMIGKLMTEKTAMQQNPFESLTSREFEIVALILKGETTKEIGNILNLQISTVSTHKAHIFSKLNVKNPLQLSELSRLHGIEFNN